MRKQIIPLTIASLTLLMLSASCHKPQAIGTFNVCSLNVDGLPAKILVVDVNPDGPADTYTPLISQYLSLKAFDFIGVQENFHYNDLLCSYLNAGYNHDPWAGDIMIDPSMLKGLNATALLSTALQTLYSSGLDDLLSDLKLPADGLNAFWKQGITLTASDRVAWNTSFGKLDHANDDLATKGFRRYELTLENGVKVVVYNMHMDASDTQDELSGTDQPDRQARLAQWRQLRDHIMRNLDRRPIVVMGDLNSYYERDSVKAVFIDPINASGEATCADAWIELTRGGHYPAVTGAAITADDGAEGWQHQNETLDKILYINPTSGYRLTPTAATLDTRQYRRPDGKPFGDHFPLAVTFDITLDE